jgi:hypothetical protein
MNPLPFKEVTPLIYARVHFGSRHVSRLALY